MDKVVVNSYEDFEKLLGRQIGVSDYVEVSQDRINLFADATLDHQWIHVDTERAKVESPYHSTIVHGDQLWYGQDEIWTGCPSRSEYPYGSKSSFFTELAWRSQG